MKYRIAVEETEYDVIGGWGRNRKVIRYYATGHLLGRKGRDLNWFNEAFAIEDTEAKAIAVCKRNLEEYYFRSQKQPKVLTGEF